MIDIGRKHDIVHLLLAMKNDDLPVIKRKQAHMALERIKKSLKDPYIQKQRIRLIAASIANDKKNNDLISGKVQDYEKKHNLRRKH